MNSNDALRIMIAHYPGGRPAMAVRLGISEEVLRKETSDGSSHKMGTMRAEQISEYCIDAQSPHCYAYVNAVAVSAGRFIELPVRDMAAPKQDLRADMAQLLKECSDAVLALTTALSDDSISDNELRVIQREVGELLSKSQDVLRGARENNESSKPAHLRAA